MIKEKILQGVGKKTRMAFQEGGISEMQVLAVYNRNKKEADAFNPFGWTIFDLICEEKNTHNPLLRSKLQTLIQEHKEKSRRSNEQNELSLQVLEYYRTNALGIGLRNVMKVLRKLSSTNTDALVVLLLMMIEFANLTAKKNHAKKTECYERKDLLLMDVSFILRENGYQSGLSYKPGKNASYIVYVYLRNGEQISWHCNNYHMMYYYDEIECVWDGQQCSTFKKLLHYAHETFGIGSTFVEYQSAA